MTELARSHGLSRTWIYELVKRFRRGGYAALGPRSRRPRSCPHQHGPEVEEAVLTLRRSLADAGHDAGAQTIAHHLSGQVEPVPAVSTIWRILSRHGLITPQPHKRPRSSFIRFEAGLPNELWQTDATHWMIDDHSRLLVASVAFETVKAADVVDEEGNAVPAGRAATYIPPRHVVTASARYDFYLDMLEWAFAEAKARGASDIDEKALRAIVEDEVRRWFEQALSEAVVVLRPMAHDAKWGPKVYETGLSDEGLTAAVVSHRWHMLSAIKRGLAGRLGRAKDAAQPGVVAHADG